MNMPSESELDIPSFFFFASLLSDSASYPARDYAVQWLGILQ